MQRIPLTNHALPDQWSILVLRAGCWLLALWAASIAVITATTYLTTTGSFDYVEGVALGHQLLLASGQPLYATAGDQPPYSVPLYGPLFYWINSLLLDAQLPSFTAARVLNLLATAWLCGLAVSVAQRRLATGPVAAWLAVLLWLTLEPAAGFLLQNRPDTLALALGASAFILATSQRRFALPGAALLLTAMSR